MNKTRLISIVLPAIIVAGSVCLWLLNRQPADERRSQRELARFVSEGSRGKPPSPRLPPKGCNHTPQRLREQQSMPALGNLLRQKMV